MLKNILNTIFARRRPAPRSAEYRAGYAHGITTGTMIERGASPPEIMLPFRDSPADWCDGYSAGLRDATRRSRTGTPLKED